MYSRIRDENFWDPDPGSGMKNLGIRIRDKTSRISSTVLVYQIYLGFIFDSGLLSFDVKIIPKGSLFIVFHLWYRYIVFGTREKKFLSTKEIF
jgi:hypothetical protein